MGQINKVMTNARWNYLVSETLFAADLVVNGVRKLCAVPVRDDDWPVWNSQMFPLHVGLHSYTSGLERLCKLTIACHAFGTTNAFPSVKGYGHQIGGLLDTVEGLDLSSFQVISSDQPDRTDDALRVGVVELLERFASGPGRYEHLDALWNDQAQVSTLDSWASLCAGGQLPEHVETILGMRPATLDAIRDVCSKGGLETSAHGFIEPNAPYIASLSTALALRLYEDARWVAHILNRLTYYTHKDFPLLGEAVQDIQPTPAMFFQYSVAQVEDEQAAVEELEEYYRNFIDEEDDEL